MRRAFAFAVICMLVVALVAPAAAALGSAKKPAPPVLVGLVTDIGPLHDNAYNEYAWQGVRAGAKAIGAEAVVVQTRAPSDYAPAIDQLVDRPAAIIVTVGFNMTAATVAAAEENPLIQFVGIDQPLEGDAPPNYESLDFDMAGAGYLAGIVAAVMTSSGTVAAVGGTAIAPVLAYMNGYRNGATSVNPGIMVLFGYAGAFDSPEAGAEVANALIDNGADVVFGVAGGSNLGVLTAACDRHVWGIGVDVDQYLQYPDLGTCIATSAEKRIATATQGAIERWWSGGSPALLPSGLYLNDASNDGIGLAPIRNPRLGAYAGLADGTIEPCQPVACNTP